MAFNSNAGASRSFNPASSSQAEVQLRLIQDKLSKLRYDTGGMVHGSVPSTDSSRQARGGLPGAVSHAVHQSQPMMYSGALWHQGYGQMGGNVWEPPMPSQEVAYSRGMMPIVAQHGLPRAAPIPGGASHMPTTLPPGAWVCPHCESGVGWTPTSGCTCCGRDFRGLNVRGGASPSESMRQRGGSSSSSKRGSERQRSDDASPKYAALSKDESGPLKMRKSREKDRKGDDSHRNESESRRDESESRRNVADGRRTYESGHRGSAAEGRGRRGSADSDDDEDRPRERSSRSRDRHDNRSRSGDRGRSSGDRAKPSIDTRDHTEGDSKERDREGRPRSPRLHLDDWMCGECKCINLSWRSQCIRCRVCREMPDLDKKGSDLKKDEAAQKQDYMEDLVAKRMKKRLSSHPSGVFKDSDWVCVECGNINWDWRLKCHMCQCAKPLPKNRTTVKKLTEIDEQAGDASPASTAATSGPGEASPVSLR